MSGSPTGRLAAPGPGHAPYGGYVCRPRFHSNAEQVGWAPSLVAGCSIDDAHYRPFTADDEAALHASFVHYERDRFWDL